MRRPAHLDEHLVKELIETAESMKLDFNVVAGKTMCADDFYEGGSLCCRVFYCDVRLQILPAIGVTPSSLLHSTLMLAQNITSHPR